MQTVKSLQFNYIQNLDGKCLFKNRNIDRLQFSFHPNLSFSTLGPIFGRLSYAKGNPENSYALPSAGGKLLL